VFGNYLKLPSTVPDRVLSLAVELTATELTPYERAVAIEKYLRQIPYTLDVPVTPSGEDTADYFLFSLQKGYCDYYATAMVVLARAAGLPARYVVGYIGQYYDASQDAFIITADQAHAWAEIYFPNYGWIPFEPTGGRPSIGRPLEEIPELPDDFEFGLEPLVPENRLSFGNWLGVFLLSFIILSILFFISILVSDLWLQRTPEKVLLPKLYKRIYRYARWAEFPLKPGVTAFRFENSFSDYFTQIGSGSFWREWLMEGVELLEIITGKFVRQLFAPQIEVDKVATIQSYKQLRTRLWLLWIMRKIYRHRLLRPIIWRNPPIILSKFD
jgi:hypothetical protein